MTMKHRSFILSVAVMLVSGGCVPPPVTMYAYPPDAPDRVAVVDNVMFGNPPNAARVEGSSKPIGFSAMVMFFNNTRMEPIMVQGGVEIRMYDGALSADALETATPRQVWEFPGDQLGQYAGRHRLLGWGYNFGLLEWGANAPTQDRVTVVVRYLGGPRPVQSSPTVVDVRAANSLTW